jgi:hypothetical protein
MVVTLLPGAPLPGQTLQVEATFQSRSDTPLEQVAFELTGVEMVRVPRGKTTAIWTKKHVHLRAEAPGRPLTVGQHKYAAKFLLPAGLPPAYRGRFVSVDYTLDVRADIPWWPDAHEKYDVPIALPPAEAPQTPQVFVSEYGGARAGELYVEMSLASTAFEPGSDVVGTVAFTNAARQKGVRVALVAWENLSADGTFWEGGSIRETHEVMRFPYKLTDGAPPEGQPLPFRFTVGPECVPSFTGAISALTWTIEITVAKTFSHQPVLRVPVRILPRSGLAPRRTPASVPAVGRDRRAQSFRRVAERLGLSYDAEYEEIAGATGDVGLRVAVETRPDGAIATVAHLAWPPLGMDLHVTPSTWKDLFSREVEVGLKTFDDRFHVHSRFPEQAQALFLPDLCEMLLMFDEVEIDDAGATLLAHVALADEAPLADFVARASQTARIFTAGCARIPLPRPLAASAGAWQAYAQRIGGRFEPGRGAIDDATFGQERVEIATEWSEGGDFQRTLVRMPLGVRVDPEAISQAARALAASLEQSGASVAITEDALSLALPQLVPDPQALEPSLEGLTRLAHAVRGRGAAGPFR